MRWNLEEWYFGILAIICMHLAGFCLESDLRLTAQAMDNISWLMSAMAVCPND
jgi:hypothetical protein